MLRKEWGIDVVSITEHLSPDPASIFIEALLEAMDEYYSINLAQEVRRGMQERFSLGAPISALPFGYKTNDGLFIPHKEQSPVVVMIYQDYLSGMACGSTLTLSSKGYSLQCCRYARGQCPHSHSITLNRMNKAVLSQIEEDINQDSASVCIRGQKVSMKSLIKFFTIFPLHFIPLSSSILINIT